MPPRTNIAFDDSGHPVPSVEFDWGQVEQDQPALEHDSVALRSERAKTIEWVLRILFYDAPNEQQLCRRAAAFAYVMKSPDAPAKSIRGLADLWGVSTTRAVQLCTVVRQIIQQNPRN